MQSQKQQEMQNWKKLLIMDPVLNSLFNPSLPLKDFLHEQILTLPHDQIVHIYSKLSTVKHALSKQVHKEVETKHQLIEDSFLSKHQLSTQLKIQNPHQVTSILQDLKDFNHNYEHVKHNLAKLQNINQIIKFSKALEKFKINCRLLKTFMKDFHKQDQPPANQTNSSRSLPSLTTNGDSLNLPKVSKLVKELNDLMAKHDFAGIKYYENQKSFIANSKETLYSLTEKQLTKTLTKYQELIVEEVKNTGETEKSSGEKMKNLEEDIKQKFKVLNCINKLKEFVPAYCKKILVTTSDILKSLFETFTIQNFEEYFVSTVFVTVLSNARLLLRLEELLTVSMLSKHLVNANMPNLFQKYIERLISYFTNLINWNLDQDAKQAEKKRANSKPYEKGSCETVAEMKYISEGKNLKVKVALVYKYPVLYAGVSSLVNKIHEQVLLRADYNREQYEFYGKKSQIMKTMLPISKRFYQKWEQVMDFGRGRDEGELKERLKVLGWFYSKIMGREEGRDSNLRGMCRSGIAVLIETVNEKLLLAVSQLFDNSDKQYEKNRQIMITKEVLALVDRREALTHYSELQRVVSHMKLIKQIKSRTIAKRQPLLNLSQDGTEPKQLQTQ